jgi:myosin heavy subunit
MAMNSLLRALGFGSREEEVDDLADCPSALPKQLPKIGTEQTSVTNRPEQDNAAEYQAAADTATATDSVNATPADDEDAFPLTIFDSLLDVFNEAQPDFIRKCLDVDAQRRYLYHSVDASLQNYIMRIKEDAARAVEHEHDNEHRRMAEEIDALREQLKESGKAADDLKALRISSDRQKRTFTERIRDLEQQLATAMAEKEQYDLEVKSLMNKLKVSQVQQAEVQELEDMRARLDEANKQITAMNAANAMREVGDANSRRETETLRKRIGDLSAELDLTKDELATKNTQLEAANAELTTTKSALSTAQNEATTAKAELTSANTELAKAQAELEAAKTELESSKAELEAAKADFAAQLEAAKAEPKASTADVLQLQNRLAEAEATMKAAEKRLVDAETRSRELQVRLDEANDKLKNATAPAMPFDTIAASATHVELPADNVEALSLPGVDDVVPEKVEPAPRKRRGRPKKDLPRISAIDESMDSTEWFVATPPEGVNMKVSTVTDAEFGYQAPPRKPQPPVNDAQMVLF